jgi:hypothetical protein
MAALVFDSRSGILFLENFDTYLILKNYTKEISIVCTRRNFFLFFSTTSNRSEIGKNNNFLKNTSTEWRYNMLDVKKKNVLVHDRRSFVLFENLLFRSFSRTLFFSGSNSALLRVHEIGAVGGVRARLFKMHRVASGVARTHMTVCVLNLNRVMVSRPYRYTVSSGTYVML